MGYNYMVIVYSIFAFIYGAVIGSFLNVLVFRLPNKMSIVKPSSHCFTCGEPIKWYDNIPILSYLILGGKCRNCKTHISPQYFLVELFTAIIYVLTYLKFRESILTILIMIVISCFIVIFLIDLKHLIIPDSMIIAILLMAIIGLFVKENNLLMIPVKEKLMGLAVTILIWGIIYLAEKIFKKELMGLGDIKLFGVVGLLIGYKLLLLGIFIGSVIALITEVVFLRHKNKLVPFGPYLVIGFTITIFFGLEILNWYSSLIMLTII